MRRAMENILMAQIKSPTPIRTAIITDIAKIIGQHQPLTHTQLNTLCTCEDVTVSKAIDILSDSGVVHSKWFQQDDGRWAKGYELTSMGNGVFNE